MQRKPHAFGVDDIVFLFARGQIVFLVWVTFGERKRSILAERRSRRVEALPACRENKRKELDAALDRQTRDEPKLGHHAMTDPDRAFTNLPGGSIFDRFLTKVRILPRLSAPAAYGCEYC